MAHPGLAGTAGFVELPRVSHDGLWRETARGITPFRAMRSNMLAAEDAVRCRIVCDWSKPAEEVAGAC